jgi:hypothetical protein
MLTNFLGVLPILTPPLCALAFIMCSKSNPNKGFIKLLLAGWYANTEFMNSVLFVIRKTSYIHSDPLFFFYHILKIIDKFHSFFSFGF